MLTTFLSAIVGSVAVFAQSQVPIMYDDVHNATTIVGTWASGAKNVVTGSVRGWYSILQVIDRH